jgi:hypothetical protein
VVNDVSPDGVLLLPVGEVPDDRGPNSLHGGERFYGILVLNATGMPSPVLSTRIFSGIMYRVPAGLITTISKSPDVQTDVSPFPSASIVTGSFASLWHGIRWSGPEYPLSTLTSIRVGVFREAQLANDNETASAE